MALHALCAGLGAPVGKKEWPASPMPWLFRMPAWARAQFLSGFCSAEALTPRVGSNISELMCRPGSVCALALQACPGPSRVSVTTPSAVPTCSRVQGLWSL